MYGIFFCISPYVYVPFLPTIMRSCFQVRIFAEVIYWCQVEYGLIRFNSALILAAVSINVAAFVGATVTLHELSR